MHADETQMYGSWSQHWATRCDLTKHPSACENRITSETSDLWETTFFFFFLIVWDSFGVLSSRGETPQGKGRAGPPGADAHTATWGRQSGISPDLLQNRAHQALSFCSALSKTLNIQHTSGQGCGKPTLPSAKVCKGRGFPNALLFS